MRMVSFASSHLFTSTWGRGEGGGGGGRGECERRTKWLARHGCRLHKAGFLKSRTGSEGAAVGRGSKNFSLSKTPFLLYLFGRRDRRKCLRLCGQCDTVFIYYVGELYDSREVPPKESRGELYHTNWLLELTQKILYFRKSHCLTNTVNDKIFKS